MLSNSEGRSSRALANCRIVVNVMLICPFSIFAILLLSTLQA